MVEDIASNVYAQWGSVGVLVSVLSAANVVQWKRGIKKDDDHAAAMTKVQDDMLEQSKEQTAALVELVTLIRDRK